MNNYDNLQPAHFYGKKEKIQRKRFYMRIFLNVIKLKFLKFPNVKQKLIVKILVKILTKKAKRIILHTIKNRGSWYPPN